MKNFTDLAIFLKALKCMTNIKFEVVKDSGGSDVKVYAFGDMTETEGHASFHFDEKEVMIAADIYEESE